MGKCRQGFQKNPLLSHHHSEQLELNLERKFWEMLYNICLRIILPRDSGSWGIYSPISGSHWLRATEMEEGLGLFPLHFSSAFPVPEKALRLRDTKISSWKWAGAC